jgi:deoxyadenosine/deoxycytidine kinase
LESSELSLYEQVYDSLELDPPTPDLVIYLQAPPPILRRRVTMRGIPYEQNLDEDYLDRLGKAYAKFFYEFDAAPLLIVNAANLDPVHRDSHYQELLRAIGRVRHGRHFFNPAIETIA